MATPLMRHAIGIALCALTAVTGCSTRAGSHALDEEFARMNEDQRIEMCTRFFRDAKVSCREGLASQAASQSYECLSARMKLDRYCVAPR